MRKGHQQPALMPDISFLWSDAAGPDLGAVHSGFRVAALLHLADRPLGLAAELLGFALELLAGLAGRAANGVPYPALDDVGGSFELVRRAFGGQVLVVCHRVLRC